MTWLDTDPDVVDGALGRHPFVLSHRLANHPLLDREAMAPLADELPASSVEHHLADLPLILPRGNAARLAASAGDIIRGLDDNRCWILLSSLDRNPEFRVLLDECLDAVAPAVGAAEAPMRRRVVSAFLAAPEAVVPVHFDRHHNMLLQVEGAKDVTIGRFEDSEVEHRELARHFDDRENAHTVPDVKTVFHLEPGDGLYIPPYRFHWVRGGSTTSVSLSCMFTTARSERTEMVHLCNSRMRRARLSPRPPGSSEVSDRTKAAVVQGSRRLRRVGVRGLALQRRR